MNFTPGMMETPKYGSHNFQLDYLVCPIESHVFPHFTLIFPIYRIFLVRKIIKNTSRAQKILNFFLMVDYIFLSICAKNHVKIQNITIFKAIVTAQTYPMFPPATLVFAY